MESYSLRSELQSDHTPDLQEALGPATGEGSGGKFCAGQLTRECQIAGGKLESDRVRRGNTKYCRACAYRLKLNRNSANKRIKRREMGWRAYDHAYGPYPSYSDPENERKRQHSAYMRVYRAAKKQKAMQTLFATD